MKIRFLGIGWLIAIGLVSCESPKSAGVGKSEYLVDNGGYSEGGFYGDSAAPAPVGYPRDGQTFATRGGVPFRYNDPVDLEDPVMEEVVPVAPVAPRPVVASRPAAPVAVDPYAAAYGTAPVRSGGDGAEVAVVTPYVERREPVEVAKPVVAVAKPAAKPVVKPAAKPAAKPVASTTAKKPGAVKAGGAKTGTTVKTVYYPPGRSGTAKKPSTVVRVHDIKRGDTLSGLASRYGVSVAHLKKRNNLTKDTIIVGKRLTID